MWGNHRGPVNSPHKWPVTRKMFPFDDVIMATGVVWHVCPTHHTWVLFMSQTSLYDHTGALSCHKCQWMFLGVQATIDQLPNFKSGKNAIAQAHGFEIAYDRNAWSLDKSPTFCISHSMLIFLNWNFCFYIELCVLFPGVKMAVSQCNRKPLDMLYIAIYSQMGFPY